jgi:hypothetical protein
MTTLQLIDNLKAYIALQLDTMSKTTPIVGIAKPIITRMVNNNIGKITKTLNLIADENGNIDVENILTEMMDNIMHSNPFVYNTSFMGDIEIGGGQIKLNLPFTNKRLVLNTTDLETFKEILTTKS